MIYLDTCVILALISSRDSHHQQANKIVHYAKDSDKKVLTSESVFIKEFLVQKIDGLSFNSMSKEQKKEGLKKARETIYDLFSDKIIPLQDNRRVNFKFQDIVIDCNLNQKEIRQHFEDLNHLAHCLAYGCSQFATFDEDFINFISQRGFDSALNKVEIISDAPNILTLKNQAPTHPLIEESSIAF